MAKINDMIPVLPPIVSCVVLAAVALLATVATVHDVIARTIPNGWCAAIALLGILARVLDHAILGGLAAAATILALITICWRTGWLGGGEVTAQCFSRTAETPVSALGGR